MSETKRGLELSVDAPAGLEAFTFEVGADEYCLFSLDFAQIATPPELTRAEREVTALVLEGRSNEQIARARGTSVSTVANQLQAIFEKLNVSGRLELVAHCVERSRASVTLKGTE